MVIDANPVGYLFIYKSCWSTQELLLIAREFVEDDIIVCDN